MKNLNIAVLPGDGIGPEITAQAVRVLQKLSDRGHFSLTLQEAPVGGAGYRDSGHPLPKPTLDLAKSADAILFGSVGDFSLDTLPRELRPEQAILGLRKELGLFANLRPAIIYPELAGASTLKPEVVSGMDLMIIRELTGDIYFGKPRGIRILENGEREGFDTMVYRESEIVRIGMCLSGGPKARQASVLGRQGQCAGDHPALARCDDGLGQGVSGCRTLSPVCRQCGYATAEESQAV